MKIQIPRCDGVCGSYFHIYADILLNLFTAQRESSTFAIRYVSYELPPEQLDASGGAKKRQRFWRVSLSFVLCTQNKFNIIRFIIITKQHKVYLL